MIGKQSKANLILIIFVACFMTTATVIATVIATSTAQTIINDLTPFMFSAPIQSNSQPAVSTPAIPARKSVRKQQNPTKKPPPQDELWNCFKTLTKYYDIDTKQRVTPLIQLFSPSPLQEREDKMAFIDQFRDRATKATLFNRAVKIATLSSVEADLSVNKQINIFTFILLCKLCNAPAFTIIYKNTYYDFIATTNADDDINNPTQHFFGTTTAPVIVYKDRTRTWAYEEWQHGAINDFKSTAIKIELINKPFMALSNYKMQELIAYHIKLFARNADNNAEKKTKQQLYDDVRNYFVDLLPKK